MRFSIEINRALQSASDLERQRQQLASCRDAVWRVKNDCPCSGNTKRALVNALNTVLTEIDNEGNIYQAMSTALTQNAEYYRYNEEKIAGCAKIVSVPLGNIEEIVGVVEGMWEKDSDNNVIKMADVWKIVGNVGIVGGIISAIGYLATEGTDIKNILKSAKYISSVIGKATSVAKDGISASWKDLFGGNNALSGLNLDSAKDTFVSSIKKQLGKDLDFTGAKTAADKVKVATKWAGHLFTLGTNAVENYEEHGGITAEGVAETIVETGVDIGVGTLVTAGVSAVAGVAVTALGFATAPAWLIGGVSTVVVIGANAASKAVWGKDLGEVVADGVWKGVEKAGEVVQDIGEGIKNVGKNLTSGVSSIWRNVCCAF